MNEVKRLVEVPDGNDCLWENLGLALIGKAKISESLTPFTPEGWGCVLSLQFVLRPN